jgi:two-component system sensor histidine kinase/response regulator
VTEIRAALQIGDQPTAQRLAHTCRGVSGNVGATLVQERATAVEMALREGQQPTQLDDLLQVLANDLALLVAGLEAQLPPAPGHPATDKRDALSPI